MLVRSENKNVKYLGSTNGGNNSFGWCFSYAWMFADGYICGGCSSIENKRLKKFGIRFEEYKNFINYL